MTGAKWPAKGNCDGAGHTGQTDDTTIVTKLKILDGDSFGYVRNDSALMYT